MYVLRILCVGAGVCTSRLATVFQCEFGEVLIKAPIFG